MIDLVAGLRRGDSFIFPRDVLIKLSQRVLEPAPTLAVAFYILFSLRSV